MKTNDYVTIHPPLCPGSLQGSVGWIKRSGSTFLTYNFDESASFDPPYKARLTTGAHEKDTHYSEAAVNTSL